MGKLLPSIELEEAKKMMVICGKVSVTHVFNLGFIYGVNFGTSVHTGFSTSYKKMLVICGKVHVTANTWRGRFFDFGSTQGFEL